MELQHKDALIEQNHHRYVYSTVRTAAIDEVKSTVNFVSLLNLSFLKMGYGPQF